MDYSYTEVSERNEITKVISAFVTESQIQLESISQTADKLGILALNANVEAIHAARFLDDFEHIITENMLIQARMVACILEQKNNNLRHDEVNYLVNRCGFEKILVTDENNNIVYTNIDSLLHKKLSSTYFSNNYEDKPINLSDEVILPKEELIDGRFRKKVAIPRRDSCGLIQVEFTYEPPRGRLTIDSFSIVAEEIRVQAKQYEFIVKKVESAINRIKELTDQEHYGEGDLAEIKICCKNLISLLREVTQISKLTNLLGIRAKIEASQSSNYVGDFDKLLNIQMLVEAKLCYLYFPDGELGYDDAIEFADFVGLDEFWLTNGDGIVNISNTIGGKGFQFVNEGQTAPFMILLKDARASVMSPPAIRALDGKVFKYVGIQRRNGGILQIGRKAQLYGESTSIGFMFVAEQVKLMSDKTKDTSIELIDKIEEIQSYLMKHNWKIA